MDDKAEISEAEAFIQKMKDLDPDTVDIIEALLVKYDKADLQILWPDIEEPKKDKLIAELEKDDDFDELFKKTVIQRKATGV